MAGYMVAAIILALVLAVYAAVFSLNARYAGEWHDSANVGVFEVSLEQRALGTRVGGTFFQRGAGVSCYGTYREDSVEDDELVLAWTRRCSNNTTSFGVHQFRLVNDDLILNGQRILTRSAT